MKQSIVFLIIITIGSLSMTGCAALQSSTQVQDDVYYQPKDGPLVAAASNNEEQTKRSTTDDYYNENDANSVSRYNDIAYNDPRYYNYGRFGFNSGYNGASMMSMQYGWGSSNMYYGNSFYNDPFGSPYYNNGWSVGYGMSYGYGMGYPYYGYSSPYGYGPGGGYYCPGNYGYYGDGYSFNQQVGPRPNLGGSSFTGSGGPKSLGPRSAGSLMREPGRHNELRMPQAEQRRPYSISSTPDRGRETQTRPSRSPSMERPSSNGSRSNDVSSPSRSGGSVSPSRTGGRSR